MNYKNMFSKCLLLLIGLCITGVLFANTQLNRFPKESMLTRMERIKTQGKETGQSVSFDIDEVRNLEAPQFSPKSNNIEEWLYHSLANSGLKYLKTSSTRYLVVKEDAPAPAPAPAGQSGSGTLKGKVLDETGDFLPGATVKVVGGSQGSATNLNGDFSLSLPAGTYTLEVGFMGYQTQRVTDVRVESGKNTPLDITLAQASTELGEVVVTATYNQASAEGLYARQRTMAAMSDGISSSMIKRTSDNNIAQSLKRISGITISGGKHVTVRGMSDRYNNVTLNGSSLPSTEANQRDFAFDIIPTGLVDNIVISKTFTPDLPGEFSGGLVEIKTLAVPDKPFLDVSLGTGGNTLSTGKPFRMNNRYTGDWFFGDIKNRKWYAGRDQEEQSMQNAIHKNNYDMNEGTGMPTQNYSISFGKPFTFGRHSLGVVGALTYRHDENTQETLGGEFINYRRFYKPFGIESMTSTDHTAATSLGAVLNVGWTMLNHKLTLRNLFNNRFTHDSQFRFLTGDTHEDVGGDDLPSIVSYFNKPLRNTLWQTQLEGEHKLWGKKLNLTWVASYNRTNRTNPDNRLAQGATMARVGEEQLLVNWGFYTDHLADLTRANSGHTMYAQYGEHKYNVGFNLEHPFQLAGNQHTIKGGYLGTFRSAAFDQLYIKAVAKDQDTWAPAERRSLRETYAPEQFGIWLKYFPTGIQPRDKYDGTQSIHAPYIMGNFSFFRKLKLTAGVRAEANNMSLTQFLRFSKTDDDDSKNDTTIYRNKTDWLPSVTAVYSILPDLNLRASYAKTIARPDFREIARLNYYDPDTRSDVISYPVKQTDVTNWDARLEWYPKPGEIISVGYFHKKFLNPLESILQLNNKNLRTVVTNLDDATVQGIELNWRKSFGFIAPAQSWLHNLYLTGNFTWLTASVRYNYYKALGEENRVTEDDLNNYNRDRVLQGLSPYVFNAALLYEGDLWGAAVHFNQVGKKLLFASQYVEADMYEAPRGVLDLQLYGRFLDKRMEVKLNATDLLNQDIIKYGKAHLEYYPRGASSETKKRLEQADFSRYEEGDWLYTRVRKGIGFSMSVSYKF